MSWTTRKYFSEHLVSDFHNAKRQSPVRDQKGIAIVQKIAKSKHFTVTQERELFALYFPDL